MHAIRYGARNMSWILAALALLVGAHEGLAQERYPSRAIELVIAFPPGGPTDLWGRLVGEEMAKILKVPVVPLNKIGASGTLGATAVLNAPRDGYTLLVNTFAGMVAGPIVLKDVTFDSTRDFIPIAFVASMHDALTVKADSPYRTVQDLLEAARRNPGKLSYASVGTGSVGHFNGEILAARNDVKLKHVPFRGGGEQIPAVLGGHVDFALGVPTGFLSLEQAGKVRFLGVAAQARMRSLPHVPTFGEMGLKGEFMENWVGLFVPAGTPKPAVDLLRGTAERIVTFREFIARIEKTGGAARDLPADEFQAAIQRERQAAIEVAKKAGMYPEGK